jgi:hypothetical protein
VSKPGQRGAPRDSPHPTANASLGALQFGGQARSHVAIADRERHAYTSREWQRVSGAVFLEAGG